MIPDSKHKSHSNQSNNITGPLAHSEPTPSVVDQPTKTNMRKKPDPNLTSGKGEVKARYSFQDKHDFIEKVNALGPNPSWEAIGNISHTTQSGAEMKPDRSLINTWKQERQHNEHKEMIELGFGNRVQRPRDATINAAKSRLASKRDPGFVFNPNNSLSKDSRAIFDNFIPPSRGRFQSLFRTKFNAVGQPINGSMMVNINFKSDDKCRLGKLQDAISETPSKNYWTSLVQDNLQLIPALKGMNFIADYGSLLLNFDTEEGSMPQPRHADYWSQPGYNEKLGKVVQGLIALSDDCEATEAYDISNVPENPSRDEFVEQLNKLKPLPEGTHLRELLVKDETPGETTRVDKWSRLVYSTNDDKPKSAIEMPRYSTMVMCGNHPHRGPGSKNGKFRLMLFFTAHSADDIETESYDNTQMTKEKLFLILLNKVHWNTIVNRYKSASKRGDTTIVSILQNDVGYLASLWADAIAESAVAGLVDNTMTFYMPQHHNCLDQLIGNLIAAAREHAKNGNKLNKDQVELGKEMIINWWKSFLVSNGKPHGRTWEYQRNI